VGPRELFNELLGVVPATRYGQTGQTDPHHGCCRGLWNRCWGNAPHLVGEPDQPGPCACGIPMHPESGSTEVCVATHAIAEGLEFAGDLLCENPHRGERRESAMTTAIEIQRAPGGPRLGSSSSQREPSDQFANPGHGYDRLSDSLDQLGVFDLREVPEIRLVLDGHRAQGQAEEQQNCTRDGAE